jgi:hypothetical protein
MKSLSENDLISCTNNCTLYQTKLTSISSDKTILQYICSEQAGKVVFHRKLRLYRNESGGYYVIARNNRCYVTGLANKWFHK